MADQFQLEDNEVVITFGTSRVKKRRTAVAVVAVKILVQILFGI